MAALEKDVAPYAFSKGTMRLPLDEPVPEKLIARIAKAACQGAAEQLKAKAAAKKKR